jgi:SNF2 family DNA or RNA helicase
MVEEQTTVPLLKRKSASNKRGGTDSTVPDTTRASVIPRHRVESPLSSLADSAVGRVHASPQGIPVSFCLDLLEWTPLQRATPTHLKLHLDHAGFRLLRGFDQLLSLEGLNGVEHLPHQIETVRKVLRRFKGRVLLADEVGLGKTIEACLLLREYLLRGLVKRALILVPNPLVSQWQSELAEKFRLDFVIPPRGSRSEDARFWAEQDRVLVSTSLAKSGSRPEAIASAPWDLVIVDEAHHCKNRTTRIWKLVNSLQRRHMFLLTATPVQNNLTELYSLLTLLEPGHLKTEADFRKHYVTKGNPRDPRNRDRLRSLLGEVMIRNTRSLVQIQLPPRYAQTITARPGEAELRLQRALFRFLRQSAAPLAGGDTVEAVPATPASFRPESNSGSDSWEHLAAGDSSSDQPEIDGPVAGVSGMRLKSLLNAHGSHPAALAESLVPLADDPQVKSLLELARSIERSAKDEQLLSLLRQCEGHKVLVFVHSLRTLHRLEKLLAEEGLPYSTFSGQQNAAQKDEAVERLRNSVPVMLCTESGGEGRNLQFADTLVNYDLPWNPMQIEQRIGRIHRYGQTRDVYVFNLCTGGSLESRILGLLNDKIRMFELVVGEVGSILGNLDGGDEFESVVLQMWLSASDDLQLDQQFDKLGESLLQAQARYLDSKQLDESLFGEDFHE